MTIDEVLFEAEEKMEHAVEFLRSEFRGLRTGRASAGLVDHIKVDYYGTPTELRQLASIATPDATMILIKPFDPSSIKEIEKAIFTSDLGITPSSDGKVIRLAVPALSTERRHQIAAQLKKMSETTRVAIRNARREANKHADKLEKASDISEDQAEDARQDIQKLTDQYEEKVTELLEAKTKEIEEI